MPNRNRVGETSASNYTHETVPTNFVEANGVRYAYRRFGKAGTIPLLFLEYFNSNMDGWDPAVTNSLARDHEVILYDNAGVGRTPSPHPAPDLVRHRASWWRRDDFHRTLV